MLELEREYFSNLRAGINIIRIQHQYTLEEKTKEQKQRGKLNNEPES